MIEIIYFKRFILSALTLVLVVGVSLAGDKDKNGQPKNGQPSKKSSVKTDSIHFVNVGKDLIEQDDTLVFEDWDSSDEDNDDGTISVQLEKAPINLTFSTPHDVFETLKEHTLPDVDEVILNKNREYVVEFTLFPNPTINELHIKTNKAPKNMVIADLSGKEHIASSYTNTIDVAFLPTGIYVLQLIFPDHIECRKFIKN